jgi:hypothetical protein
MSVNTASGETGKDQPGTPGNPVSQAHGGPDAFGYRWADSDDPVGPAFDWVDISGVGTSIPFSGDDQNQGPFPLPFPFTYYGTTYTSFRACTNGWITLDATNTQTTFTNVALPNSASTTPPALIAPFWDDLTFSSAGHVYYHYDGAKFIISYVGVPRLTSGGPYTFQILLYPSGTIDFQYLDMQGTRLNEATVGIQNANKDVGLTVAFNANYVKDHLRVRFSSQPGWLTLAKLSGVTPAGARDTIPVNCNATGLADGDYDGVVRIASNDLDEPLTTVPVDLHVGVVAAGFAMDPNSINQSSNGKWLAGTILPPSPITPQAVVAGSVLLQRTVPVAAGAPVEFGTGSVTYKFDRAALQAVLPVGPSVPVEAIGRFGDDTWFQASASIKVLRPAMRAASVAVTGEPMPIQVQGATTVPLLLGDPLGYTASHFDLWYSADNGESWSTVAENVTERTYAWLAPSENIDQAQLMLIAYDQDGVMGWMITNVFEVVDGATATSGRPLPDRVALRFAGRHPASEARLEMALPKRGTVDARVYDVRGARVSTLASGEFDAGYHPLLWNGRDAEGRSVDAGVYFIRVASGGQSQNLRFVLVH